jgi:hypothetical protein
MNSDRPNVFGPEFDHLCLRVDGAHLADVTASFANAPLALADRGVQVVDGVEYRLAEVPPATLRVVLRHSQHTSPRGAAPGRGASAPPPRMFQKRHHTGVWIDTFLLGPALRYKSL